MKVLKPFFEENHNLLEIDLEWSLLGLEGIELFSRILQRRTRKNLEVLKIKGRNILVQTNNNPDTNHGINALLSSLKVYTNEYP